MKKLTCRGRCFCGAIAMTFETVRAPKKTPLRMCNCSFCLKHGARNTSDPEGRVRFLVKKPARLSKFDFRKSSGGRLLCSHCGVYLGIAYRIDGRWYASLNVNALDRCEEFSQAPEVVDYSRETKAAKAARRTARWTPAAVTFA